jgi:hypothetical protein
MRERRSSLQFYRKAIARSSFNLHALHAQITGAMGVKICANNLESTVAGSPLLVVEEGDDIDDIKVENTHQTITVESGDPLRIAYLLCVFHGVCRGVRPVKINHHHLSIEMFYEPETNLSV